MNSNVFPVLMAGGASSRLWPLSDVQRPKWDLRIFGQTSLLQDAWARAKKVAPLQNCLVVAGADHERLIRRSLADLPVGNLLIEPCLRDTAGAVAYAAGRALQIDPQGALLVLPGDGLIRDLDRFGVCGRAAIALGFQEDAFVTFGIVPRSPATCYGYIHRAASVVLRDAPLDSPPAYHMHRFVEKPDLETAESYIDSGDYYWNSGIFVFPLVKLMASLNAHLAGHAEMARLLADARDPGDWSRIADAHYPNLKKISIDFGIMEHATRLCTVAADFDWDDIGSWSAVRDHLPKEGDNGVGPRVRLDAVDARKNLVYAPGQRVAIIGLENVAVVSDNEGLLVCDLRRDQEVKEVSKRDFEVRCLDIKVPSQERQITVALVEPECVSPETGLMLILHGMNNSRLQYQTLMRKWATRYNVICIAPEYRGSGLDVDPLNGKGGAVPYDFSHLQLVDCLNAYHAVKRRYPRADAARSHVWGGSQGGHLAVLLAAFAPRTFAICINACGLAWVDDELQKRSHTAFDAASAAIRDARLWVDRIQCPIVLMHGTADEVVSDHQTRELAAALARAGKDFSVRFIANGDHFLAPQATRWGVTEELADPQLRNLRRAGRDDFEAQSRYVFPCPGNVTFTLDFSDGIAHFSRKG